MKNKYNVKEIKDEHNIRRNIENIMVLNNVNIGISKLNWMNLIY